MSAAGVTATAASRTRVRKIRKETDYDRYSKVFDIERSAAGSDVICAFLQFYTGIELQHMKVLDAGGGTGTITKALIEHGVGNVSLIDASKGMLEVAKAKLSADINSGSVGSIVHNYIPPIPFPDKSFDAVMFNLYFYLEGSRDDSEHIRTLQEARRILKPGGVVLTSSILRSSIADTWHVKLDEALRERFVSKFPDLQWYDKMFYESRLSCAQKITLLGTDILPNYFRNPISFIRNEMYFVNATYDEMDRVYKKIDDLKREGLFQKWIAEHGETTGLVTMFVCKAN